MARWERQSADKLNGTEVDLAFLTPFAPGCWSRSLSKPDDARRSVSNPDEAGGSPGAPRAGRGRRSVEFVTRKPEVPCKNFRMRTVVGRVHRGSGATSGPLLRNTQGPTRMFGEPPRLFAWGKDLARCYSPSRTVSLGHHGRIFDDPMGIRRSAITDVVRYRFPPSLSG